MTEFPLGKDEWYAKRDSRTNISVDSSTYQKTKIGIKVDSRIKSSFSLQCMTLLSCNILARWCREVVLDIPECDVLISNQKITSFPELVRSIMSQIDPFGKFSLNCVEKNNVEYTLEIGNVENGSESVWIHGEGWNSGCGFGISPKFDYQECVNPIGPVFAACLGSSMLFELSSKNSIKKDETWHDLLEFHYSAKQPQNINRNFPQKLDLGNIHQIGCGAVGSSLDYLISLTNLEGDFTLIDNDEIDFSNCNRSLPFTAFHAIQPTTKTQVCENTLKDECRQVSSFTGLYSEFTKQKNFANLNPDIILSLANEDQVWSHIQDNYPPLTLHATTTSSWGINFGRHIPLSEWCILCRFSSNLKDNYVPICETGVINQKEETPIFGVLPFLSPAAAVLLLAELIKLSYSEYPINENFVEYSLQSPFNHIKYYKKPKKDCTCSRQFSSIYKKYRGSTKFWHVRDLDLEKKGGEL